MNVNIQINDLEIAKAIAHTRHFKEAVEGVVEDMDLGYLLDAPTRTEVEVIVGDMGVPTSDEVYDIARDAVRDGVSNYLSSSMGEQVIKKIVEEVLEDLGVTRSPLAAQARIEALERQVLRLEGTLARVADVLLGKPVERIVSAAIAEG